MITPKIKALFQFIEYLHSNIDNFKQYDELINELHLLDKERQKVNNNNNYKEKLRYDEIQEEIKEKFKIINFNITIPIVSKVNELKICDPNKTETLWNWNIAEISNLMKNFSKDDLPEIFSYKNKYLEYRTATKGEAFFSLGFLFDSLNEILKPLFDFFKETEQNEFEAFETKSINAENLTEGVEYIQTGHKKISFSSDILLNQPKIKSSKIYKVSKIISNVKDSKGEGIECKKTELENEYILRNKNIYSKHNDLIKEAENPKDYDSVFYLRLKHLNPFYKISDFLNYHYSNTENKELFMKHIKYEILNYFKPDNEQQRIDFIKEWIEENAGQKIFFKSEKNEYDLTSDIAMELINEYDLEFFKNYVAKQRVTLSEVDFATTEKNIVQNWYEEGVKKSFGNKAKFHKHQLNIIQKFIDEISPIEKEFPPQPIVESPFSVLEWATIFYYADETNLLPESRFIKVKMEQFMSKHNVTTTPENFKTKYYDAKRRINEKNDYPIKKLETIIPFLEENYKQTVTKVKNDITFLEEEKPEY